MRTRFLAVDAHLRPTTVFGSGEPKYWAIVLPPDTKEEVRYVLVPIPKPDARHEAVICSLENGFHTLEYLVAHPDIKAI